MIRAFLAIELPDSLRPGLAQVQEELKRSRADVRWVRGGQHSPDLEILRQRPGGRDRPSGPGSPAGGGRGGPLQLQATSAGAFPSPHAPRVVWLGLGGDVLPLTQLYYRLEKAFVALGYLPEGRAFNPHLTLGRVKSPANRERLARLLAKLPPLNWPPFEVKELILFQSVLSPQGSTYTPLEVIPLG